MTQNNLPEIEEQKLNYTVISINSTTFYFSYKTVIAFHNRNTGLVISRNTWGPSTGKHLNYVNPDKSIRVSREEFKRQYEAVTI